MTQSTYWRRQVTFWGAVAFMAAGCAVAHPVGTRAQPAEPVSVPSQRQVRASDGALWVIFIDDLHLDFRATGRLRDLFGTISQALIHDGDSFAIVSSGPSSLAIDTTQDPKRLDEVKSRISGSGMKPSEILAELPEPALSEVRYRAHVAFATAYGVMKMLEQARNRPKALIYISNGYNLDIRPTDSLSPSAAAPFQVRGNRFSVEQLRDEVAALIRQAKRSNVSIFGIDPRELGAPPVDLNVDAAAWQRYWTTSRNSLQVISEQTGGFFVHDDLPGGLARIPRAARN